MCDFPQLLEMTVLLEAWAAVASWVIARRSQADSIGVTKYFFCLCGLRQFSRAAYGRKTIWHHAKCYTFLSTDEELVGVVCDVRHLPDLNNVATISSLPDIRSTASPRILRLLLSALCIFIVTIMRSDCFNPS